ncbi:endo-1,4-beta-xylanase [Mucilaginibacter sp. ZB1P21]|uniref:Beta-xylanase n=1 Tax=Mucilaginibacter glaciei TaxID=2772109 RepID=A0A926S375_9SPHI|nr:endo-1,4-beta-xylanase [Mucilaginibacter glaciei]
MFGSSCIKKDPFIIPTTRFTETTNPTPTAVTPTLRNSASFPVGTAVDDSPMNTNKTYSTILGNEFSSITPESAMKFDRVEWKQNNFDFSAGDAMVDFALSHNQRVHGHTLVWQHALPNWVKSFSGDSTAWEGIFKNHITAMVSHYKGKVKSWDVVNEAIDDNDGSLTDKDKYGPGTGSLWRQHLGANYIVRAFKYAHEADPASLLFYNDYGNDNGGWNDAKIKSVISIVNSVKNAGGTISGIGIQMHINLTTDNKNIKESLRQFAATGLLIHISELDISVNPSNNPLFVFSENFKTLQAEKYQFLAKTYREVVPKVQQFGITTWQFSDAYSEATLSGKNDFRLLFDMNYQKKAAYDSYLKGLMN